MIAVAIENCRRLQKQWLSLCYFPSSLSSAGGIWYGRSCNRLIILEISFHGKLFDSVSRNQRWKSSRWSSAQVWPRNLGILCFKEFIWPNLANEHKLILRDLLLLLLLKVWQWTEVRALLCNELRRRRQIIAWEHTVLLAVMTLLWGLLDSVLPYCVAPLRELHKTQKLL